MRTRLKTDFRADRFEQTDSPNPVAYAWKDVQAAIANYQRQGELRPCDYTPLSHVEPDGKVYERDIRTVVFYIGRDLHAVHAMPHATDENTPTGKATTFLFNVSQSRYLGGIWEAIQKARAAQETERQYMRRTSRWVMHNLNIPAHIKARGVHFIGEANNALWGYQLFHHHVSTAESALARYHPEILKRDKYFSSGRHLVPEQFHTKFGM